MFKWLVQSKDRMTSEFDKTKDMIEKGNRSFLIKDSLETGVMPNRTDRVLGDIGLVKQGNQNPNLPQPLPKVLDRMIWMIRAGEQKSSIRIHPPELGRLDLDLAIKNGHLQANLSAESTMVKEVIEANLNQLKQHLNAQGLIVDSFEVMVGLNDRRFKDGELWSGNRRNASSSKRSIASGNASVITKEPSGRPVDHMYQIDVHV